MVVSLATMSELELLLGDVAADDSLNVLVLTGGAAGLLVAHADLEDLMRLGHGEAVEGDPGSAPWG